MTARVLALFLTLVASAAGGADRNPQVVGGTPVDPGQFPFVVGLVYGTQGICTGSLVRPRWVLTAAHCTLNGAPATHVAITDMYPGLLGTGHTVSLIPVARWIPHPQYNDLTLDNDVALIELASDATKAPPRLNGSPLYTPTPIQLASAPANTTTSIGPVVIAGFGLTDFLGSLEYLPLVMWAEGIPTYGTAVCDAEYPTLDPAKQLCFGSYPNICQGDSGGAVFRKVGSQFTQYGIVSGNRGPTRCGDVPSIATYVPGFLSWINQQIDGTTDANPIKYGWELPPSSADGIATGVSNAQGWAFSTAGAITSVRLERNGQHFLTLPCCSERGDIQTAIPGAPGMSGFSAAVSWGLLGNGTTNLTLVIRDSAGNEVRETRTVKSIQVLNGRPLVTGLGFTAATRCQLFMQSGRAFAECSGLSFQQGTCSGDITFGWQNGKQSFEVVEGCR
jgi:trypsin